VDEAFAARRRAQNGLVGGNGLNGNTLDEGYQSGDHDSDDDNQYNNDFDRFDDDDDDDN